MPTHVHAHTHDCFSVCSVFLPGSSSTLSTLHSYPAIENGGSHIHTLLKEFIKVLKVCRGLPDWKTYVGVVSSAAVEGLAHILNTFICFLSEQLESSTVKRADRQLILEIELTLVDSEIVFSRDLFEIAKRDVVRGVMYGWVDSFFNVATIFKRLDTRSGTYLKELQNGMAMSAKLRQLSEFMQNNEDQMGLFRNKYDECIYLRTTDLPA